ncbi:Nicotinamide/nicotinic acid mononucleotide adenylyltransferase 2 [Balamuthia mandrillaris]
MTDAPPQPEGPWAIQRQVKWKVPKSKLEVPLDKALKNVNAFLASSPSEEQRMVVLVSSGAFSPIHKSHLQLLEDAKKYCESDGKSKVVAGYLSPSDDRSVKGKLQGDWIEAKHRIEMCKIAVQDSDWLDVSDWESGHRGWSSPTMLLNHIAAYIEQNSSSSANLFPIFVCSAEHAAQYNLFAQTSLEVIAVARSAHVDSLREAILGKKAQIKTRVPTKEKAEGEDEGEEEEEEEEETRLVVEGEVSGRLSALFHLVASGTMEEGGDIEDGLDGVAVQLRKKIKAGEEAEESVVPAAVAAYLKQHRDALFGK